MSLRPRQLTNITTAVAEVEKAKPSERLAIIRELLRGTVDPRTAGGKALLHRRALFVSELRAQKVWTG